MDYKEGKKERWSSNLCLGNLVVKTGGLGQSRLSKLVVGVSYPSVPVPRVETGGRVESPDPVPIPLPTKTQLLYFVNPSFLSPRVGQKW